VNRGRSLILTLIVLLASAEAWAACSVTTTGLTLGNYDAFSLVSLDSTASVTVACDQTPPANVTVSFGPSAQSGVMNPRQMKHLTLPDRLNYNLFTDIAKTAVWGDGTAGTTTVFLKNVKKNKPVTVTVYGTIPPAQNVSVGSYADTVIVTIVW
jgi:spore coat protein U-like protein